MIPDGTQECCDVGSYVHSVPIQTPEKTIYSDRCIAPIVEALNAAGIKTEASCCGHGEIAPTVILSDDTWMVLMSRQEAHAYFGMEKQ